MSGKKANGEGIQNKSTISLVLEIFLLRLLIKIHFYSLHDYDILQEGTQHWLYFTTGDPFP